MKALRLNAPNDLEYCDVPVPKPEQFEVLCKVESSSICGTDPHIIAGGFPGFWPQEFPLIPGHEWAGTIVELGEKSADMGWKIGDRVTGSPHCGCGHCAMCMEGRYNLCLNYGRSDLGHRQYGHYTDGSYAEYMVNSINSIEKIPDSMDFDVGSCINPLGVALHGVMHCGVEPGDDVFINGSGSQGLMSILCAHSMGAGQILISGSGSRLQAAKSLGATIIDYKTEDVVKRVKELTGGRGAKRVIDCTGSAAGFRNACDAVAKGGFLSAVGLAGDVQIPMTRLILDEVMIFGNRADPNKQKKAISIAQKYYKEINQLITHRLPMHEYEKAFQIFTGRLENSIKVVIKPWAK